MPAFGMLISVLGGLELDVQDQGLFIGDVDGVRLDGISFFFKSSFP